MTVLLSLNEIGAATEKALRGLDAHWGQVRDGGAVMRLAAASPHPVFGEFAADALRSLKKLATRPAYVKNNPAQSKKLAALPQGMALLLFLAENDGGNDSWRGEVIGAGFLVACMVLLARESDSAMLTLRDEKGSLAAVLADSKVMARNMPLADGVYEISCNPPDTGETSRLVEVKEYTNAGSGVEIADTQWHSLLEYAALSYVPESTQSRNRGAGAGDIDND